MNINEGFSSNNIVLRCFFVVKHVLVKSQGQFALSLIWRADSLLTPRRQVKTYAEQTRVKKGGKGIKREREKQDEKQSGQELIQLCKEV